MLDTFPVVKFGSSNQDSEIRRPKDIEAPHPETAEVPAVERAGCVELGHVTDGVGHLPRMTEDPAGVHMVETAQSPQPRITANTVDPSPNPNDAVIPEAIGRETCPICILDFEEGDDLRILPCEGKHRFHQTCVDPWLLELSGSCPLCRQGELGGCLSGFPYTIRLYRFPCIGDDYFWGTTQRSARCIASEQSSIFTRNWTEPILSLLAVCPRSAEQTWSTD